MKIQSKKLALAFIIAVCSLLTIFVLGFIIIPWIGSTEISVLVFLGLFTFLWYKKLS